MSKPVFKVAPYAQKSSGCFQLSKGIQEALGLEMPPDRIFDNYYHIPKNEWVINWGNGNFRGSGPGQLFNTGGSICLCVNKIDFFNRMDKHGIVIPTWTTRSEEAQKWVKGGETVYCRTDIEGRDGRGIVVASRPTQFAEARLYTKAVPSTEEFRAHVFRGEVIFELEKWRQNTATADQLAVRSGGNGWIYVRDTALPKVAKLLAEKVCVALDMDFCAVDILWNSKTRRATVLEANSAPELGPWTRKAYAKKFIELWKAA